MALPSDLTTIVVTGTFTTITGTPLTGQVNFSLTTPVEDSTGKVIFNAFTQSVPLNSAGFMSIVLPCTDNADLNPTNFSYLVTEAVPGLGRAYYVQLPHTLGSTVDLSSLAPVATPPATSAFATANTWTATQTFGGNPSIKIPGGAASGDVLTSDASGNATWQPVLASKVVALTDAPVIAVNAAAGGEFTVTLGGNRALGNPSGPLDGQNIVFVVTQDATGSRTLSYGSAYAFSTSLPVPTLSTSAGATDYLGFTYSAAVSRWRFVAFVSGF